jgi:hypothetical protein
MPDLGVSTLIASNGLKRARCDRILERLVVGVAVATQKGQATLPLPAEKPQSQHLGLALWTYRDI